MSTKLLPVVLASCLAVGLTACGGGGSDDDNGSTPAPAPLRQGRC